MNKIIFKDNKTTQLFIVNKKEYDGIYNQVFGNGKVIIPDKIKTIYKSDEWSPNWKTTMKIYVECCGKKLKPERELITDTSGCAIYYYNCKKCGNSGSYKYLET